VKHELIELVVCSLWNCMVVGSNLSRSKLNFLYFKVLFGMNVEEHRNPSSYQRGNQKGWETTHNGP